MIIFILLMIFVPSMCKPMANSFILPTYINKINFTTVPFLTYVSISGSHGYADKSYNKKSELVPLLAFNGPEDLLNRFVDPTLPNNDISKVGQAIFSGTFTVNSAIGRFSKNFDHGVFITGRSGISNICLKNVAAHPVSASGQCLTTDEIGKDAALKSYLKLLDEKILEYGKPIKDLVVNVSTLTIGWAKNFQFFEHADFINIALQTGIRVPGVTLNDCNNNSCNSSGTLQIPIERRHNLGFPLQADMEIGLLNWLNIGLQGGAVFYVSNDTMIKTDFLSTNDYNLCTTKDLPMVYSHLYFEAEELLPKLSCLLGLSFVQQFKTTYLPSDIGKCSCSNNKTLQDQWNRTNLHLQAQIDCSKIDTKFNWIFAFLYTRPITGTSVFQLSRTGGSLAIAATGSF